MMILKPARSKKHVDADLSVGGQSNLPLQKHLNVKPKQSTQKGVVFFTTPCLHYNENKTTANVD